eukprot:TRINITY_DN955_c0_g1_i3.p1 TRINITY_DN955_c0_g1~~TRINITY_DN955_c0_g1_i3.p1  ORF type:complete len:262 (-),score=25.82 TRINITY_DN955_c0_g1_i3:1281-2066(-)
MPFTGQSDDATRASICRASPDFQSKVWLSISTEAKDLCERLLRAVPAERISTKEVCQHAWMRNASNGIAPTTTTPASTAAAQPSLLEQVSSLACLPSPRTLRVGPFPSSPPRPDLSERSPIVAHSTASPVFCFNNGAISATQQTTFLPSFFSFSPPSQVGNSDLCSDGSCPSPDCCAALPCSTPCMFRHLIPNIEPAKLHFELTAFANEEESKCLTIESRNCLNGSFTSTREAKKASGLEGGWRFIKSESYAFLQDAVACA